MNRKTMLFTMMMATAIVLLVGCHEGNRKGHSNELQTSASIDTSTLDEGYCVNKTQNMKLFIRIV